MPVNTLNNLAMKNTAFAVPRKILPPDLCPGVSDVKQASTRQGSLRDDSAPGCIEAKTGFRVRGFHTDPRSQAGWQSKPCRQTPRRT